MGYTYHSKASDATTRSEPADWPEGWTYPGSPYPPGWDDGGQDKHGNKIYETAGTSAGDKATYEYTPGTNAWAAKTDHPEGGALSDPMAASISTGTVNVVGGLTGGTYNDDNDEYDPDTWTAKTVASPGRYRSGASSYSGIMYVHGGSASGDTYMTDADSWDGSSWTALTDLSEGHYKPYGATLDATIYAFGGNTNAGGYDPDTLAYSISGDSWSAGTDVPETYQQMNVGAVENVAYLLSGQDASDYQSDVRAYDPDTWSTKTNAVSPVRGSCNVASTESAVYVMSGQNSGGGLTDNDEYIPSADAWRNAADSQIARTNGVAMAIVT